jgi:hypothetical protein
MATIISLADTKSGYLSEYPLDTRSPPPLLYYTHHAVRNRAPRRGLTWCTQEGVIRRGEMSSP